MKKNGRHGGMERKVDRGDCKLGSMGPDWTGQGAAEQCTRLGCNLCDCIVTAK